MQGKRKRKNEMKKWPQWLCRQEAQASTSCTKLGGVGGLFRSHSGVPGLPRGAQFVQEPSSDYEIPTGPSAVMNFFLVMTIFFSLTDSDDKFFFAHRQSRKITKTTKTTENSADKIPGGPQSQMKTTRTR